MLYELVTNGTFKQMKKELHFCNESVKLCYNVKIWVTKISVLINWGLTGQ